MKLDYIVIGERIRFFRKQKGLTQAQLAEISEIEPTNISHIERAATKLSLASLVRIANALDVTLDDLVYTNLKKSEQVSVSIINELLSDCTSDELKSIARMIKTTKDILRDCKN